MLVVACAQNPVSGRPEVVSVSAAKEQEIGADAAKQVEETMGLVDGPLQRYVGEVGRRLAEQSPRQEVEYHFAVADREEPNAFALPGGYIYVTRGLLALVESEDELAGILAHEVGHVAAKHYARSHTRSRRLLPLRIALGLGGAAASLVSPALAELVTGLGGAPVALLLSAHSREQEREADSVGQKIAAAAGWDPAALSSFMTTLGNEEALLGGDPSRYRFFSTHPTSPERSATTLRAARTLDVAAAKPIARNRRAFLKQLDGIQIGPSPAKGVFQEERFLQPEMDFGIDFPSGWETSNTDTAVSASDPDGRGLVVLQLAREDSALAAADAFSKQRGVRNASSAEKIQIGNLQAARVSGVVGRGRSANAVEATFIEHNELLFRVLTATGAQQDDLGLGAVADSFHPLSTEARASIRQLRLRIFEANAGESLEALLKRSGTSWSPEQASVANSLDRSPLSGGRLVKLAVPEKYPSN
jgi:predicted Zn-dependent protease